MLFQELPNPLFQAERSTLAATVTATYISISALWIVLSDQALALFVPATQLTGVQTIKGWLFVLLTGGLLYAVIQQGQKQLVKSYCLLKAIIETANTPIFVKDREGRYLLINSAGAEAVGKPIASIIGKTDHHLFDPVAATALVKADREVFESGASRQFEENVLINDRQRTFLSAKRAYYDRESRPVAIIGVAYDISERKQAERSLARFAQELEQRVQERTRALELAQQELKQRQDDAIRALEVEQKLNKLRSDFISQVSHEFRTPLTVIRTSITLIQQFRDRVSPAQLETYFNTITRSIKTLTQLLDDLLLIAQAESQRLEFQPEDVDLDAVCQSIVHEITLADAEKHPVQYHFEGNSYSEVDEKIVRTVLVNLLTNAVKYTPEGKTITFTVNNQGFRAVTLQIKDEGIGIPPDDLKNLFQPFYRASNVGKIHGTGLGLSIVKHCVELHGGDIQVNSNHQGTTFTVRLKPGKCDRDLLH